MLLLNKETMIQDIIQDMVSCNEGASGYNGESRHESGQTVPIGNTSNLNDIGQSVQYGNRVGNRDTVGSRETTKI